MMLGVGNLTLGVESLTFLASKIKIWGVEDMMLSVREFDFGVEQIIFWPRTSRFWGSKR